MVPVDDGSADDDEDVELIDLDEAGVVGQPGFGGRKELTPGSAVHRRAVEKLDVVVVGTAGTAGTATCIAANY